MRPMHGQLRDDADMDGSLLAPRLAQFVAVARHEHMTRAAGELGMPQSTLSRGIARLEADVGVALFLRSGRQLRLTRAGRVLRASAERALAELDQAVQAVAGEVDPVHGRVTLAFLHTLGPQAVPRILRQFRAEHPSIRVDLVQAGHEAVLGRLRDGDADLCLTSPLPADPHMHTEPLQEQRLSLAVPAAHPLARRRRVRLAEVAGEQFVGFQPGYGLRAITEAWCRQAGFTPRLAFEGQDVETVRGLVGAGLGVALLPGAGSRSVPGVVELRVTEPATTRTVGLVWRRDHPESAPVRAFREFVLDAGRGLLRDGGT